MFGDQVYVNENAEISSVFPPHFFFQLINITYSVVDRMYKAIIPAVYLKRMKRTWNASLICFFILFKHFK